MVRGKETVGQVESFEDEIKKSPLYTLLHLIDDAFLAKKISEKTRKFLLGLSPYLSKSSTLLIEKKVLIASDFQERVLSETSAIDINIFIWLLSSEQARQSLFSMLIEKKVLLASTLWSKFLHHKNFFNLACYVGDFDWKHLVESGILDVEKINSPTDGFDAVEVKALQLDLLGSTDKVWHYPINPKAHSLVQRLRGQENTKKMSKQIEVVLGPSGQGSVMEDFGKVFDFYLKRAPLYQKLLQRDQIVAHKRKEDRTRNIKIVNGHQLSALKNDNPGYQPPKSFDPKKRHFDIYARYGHGSMDPLQLAFISRAAEWYIMGGRSRLFNSVRVVPYISGTYNDEDIPYVALAACQGAELLNVAGRDFTRSMVGANRTFLTHSNSMEATREHSIPIIGLATYNNSEKRSKKKKDFVLFEGNFDPEDFGRFDGGKAHSSKDVNGDIAELINETLRTLMEVEDKEIARAEAADVTEELQLAA